MFSELREHGTLRESAREPLQLVDDFIACIQLAVGAQVRAVRLFLGGARARRPRRSRRLIPCFPRGAQAMDNLPELRSAMHKRFTPGCRWNTLLRRFIHSTVLSRTPRA